MPRGGRTVALVYFFSARIPVRTKNPVSIFPATNSGCSRMRTQGMMKAALN